MLQKCAVHGGRYLVLSDNYLSENDNLKFIEIPITFITQTLLLARNIYFFIPVRFLVMYVFFLLDLFRSTSRYCLSAWVGCLNIFSIIPPFNLID